MRLRGPQLSAGIRSWLLAALASGWLAACSGGPETVQEPLTAEDLAERAAPREPPLLGRVEGREFLFTNLDQNLRSWRVLSSSGQVTKQYQLRSLEDALTQHVYLNFDTILNELQDGDPQFRPIAAAALGFSVIPAPEEPGGDPAYPQVHERAVQPLVNVIQEGDDVLTQNALLALACIASPVTPIDLIKELALTHHEEDVRSNAALVLAKVLQPHHRDQVLTALYAALGDESAKVRLHVVSALGAVREHASGGQLIGVVTTDDSTLVRANAVRVLGDLGVEESIPLLISGLQSPSLRNECRRSLTRITEEDFGDNVDRWRNWYQSHY
jgi:hypothetical protein